MKLPAGPPPWEHVTDVKAVPRSAPHRGSPTQHVLRGEGQCHCWTHERVRLSVAGSGGKLFKIYKYIKGLMQIKLCSLFAERLTFVPDIKT